MLPQSVTRVSTGCRHTLICTSGVASRVRDSAEYFPFLKRLEQVMREQGRQRVCTTIQRVCTTIHVKVLSLYVHHQNFKLLHNTIYHTRYTIHTSLYLRTSRTPRTPRTPLTWTSHRPTQPPGHTPTKVIEDGADYQTLELAKVNHGVRVRCKVKERSLSRS